MMQHDNMSLHAKLSKLHTNIKQTPRNGAAVQHIHTKQDIVTICPKQQLGIMQALKQYATATQLENRRHGHDVHMKHNKT